AYWNIIVRHEACMRRGLKPEDFPYQDFLNACREYGLSEEPKRIIQTLNGELTAAHQELNRIHNLRSYRLIQLLVKSIKRVFRIV
ncbi:MAG: hypothetical protein LBQ64_06065, partial [Bacteroidales bacterium]|nr:hypothetical protein [Bacteroidales bacterium]